MNENKEPKSFVRFIMPVLLITAGVPLMVFVPQTAGLSDTVIRSAGLGLYSAGSMLLVLIYNHARNPVADDTVISNATQGLVVYSGLIVTLFYQKILPIEASVTAVSIVMVFGILVSVLFEYKGSVTVTEFSMK